MNYRQRQARLREELQRHRLDALVVSHPANVRYLCGFTGSAGVLLLTSKLSMLATDGRYREQARQEVHGARVRCAQGSLLAAAAAGIAKQRLRRVGMEAHRLTVGARDLLAGLLPAKARLRPTAGLVERLRMIKEPEEVERLRKAVILASSLFEPLLRLVRPGVSERDLAAELEYLARRAGASAMSFPTIVAAGARSALPHGIASSQPIPNKGFVIVDFGVILADYCSDMTRTVFLGRPSRRDRELYRAVLEAQQSALAVVQPGVAAGSVDRAARRVLQRAGLARYFPHSTGHGVGLEIHEPPRLGSGEKEVLKPGMVITVEPGVYIAKRGGVRIEDMVVLTENGCEVLTPTSKELITL